MLLACNGGACKRPSIYFVSPRFHEVKQPMTTIVYEGATRTLYCDSMVTSTVADVTSRTDMTYKVEDLSRLKIVTRQRERLVAMAYSGPITSFQRITKFILANLHDWGNGLQRLADHGASLQDCEGAMCVLVTNKQLHCFRFGRGTLDVEEVDLDQNVTFGSGGAFAKGAMEVYGASGFDAMAAAALCDPGTGCLIHAYRIERNRLVTLPPVLYQDSTEERLRLRKRAGKSQLNLKPCNLFDHPPENILVKINENAPFIKRIRQAERAAQPKRRSKKEESVQQTADSSTKKA